MERTGKIDPWSPCHVDKQSNKRAAEIRILVEKSD